MYRSNVSKIRHLFSIVTLVKKKKKKKKRKRNSQNTWHEKKPLQILKNFLVFISLRQPVYYYYYSKKECLCNSKNYS